MPPQVTFVLHYLQIPFRRPRLLLALTALPVIMALILMSTMPPSYQTSAVIALIRTRTDVTFDERIRTVTGEDPVGSTRSASDIRERAVELTTLVENGAIADDVIARLKDQLPANYQDSQELVDKVDASILDPGSMIAITVADEDPEMAALLANTWASSYETYINALYSNAAVGYSQSVEAELQRAKANYDAAQQALEAFLPLSQVDALTRTITDKEVMLDTLSVGRTTAVSNTVEQQILNQTQIITTYMSAQMQNQLLAFNKQQEAKRTLLGEFIDAEIESRMRALRYDRTIRENAFSVTSEADMNNKLAVVQEEVLAKREALAQAYAEQTRLTKLLGNAQTMRDHIAAGGDGAAASNTFALLLLKTQVFTGEAVPRDTNETVPQPPDATAVPLVQQAPPEAEQPRDPDIQFQVTGTTPTTAAEQLQDIEAIITALQNRIDALARTITEQSNALLSGTGYNFLSEFSANANPVAQTPALSSTLAVSVPLSSAIQQRYEELFDVGTFAQNAERTAESTPLFAEIKKLYPDLFSIDALSELTGATTESTALRQAIDERTAELLGLQQLQALPSSDATASIDQLIEATQTEVNTLRSQLEAETARLADLTSTRDIARETWTTLSTKREEVTIASAITDSEVRLAVPAMTATEQTGSILLTLLMAGALGFLFGIVVTFALHFVVGDAQLQPAGRHPNAPWNRAFRWLTAPTAPSFRWARRDDDSIASRGERSVSS